MSAILPQRLDAGFGQAGGCAEEPGPQAGRSPRGSWSSRQAGQDGPPEAAALMLAPLPAPFDLFTGRIAGPTRTAWDPAQLEPLLARMAGQLLVGELRPGQPLVRLALDQAWPGQAIEVFEDEGAVVVRFVAAAAAGAAEEGGLAAHARGLAEALAGRLQRDVLVRVPMQRPAAGGARALEFRCPGQGHHREEGDA